MYFRFFFLLLALPLYSESPWGKDADLAYPRGQVVQEKKRGPLNQLAQRMIWFHKNVISPADGPRSHFWPSSSMYTLQAIKKYGVLRGIPMGCDRLMRENPDPWVYQEIQAPDGRILKHDPVP